MNRRIRCLFHAEETPSLVMYAKNYICYGCGKRGPLSELPADLVPKEGERYEETKEDLQTSIRYIRSLPKERVRGLELHADKRGYFIVWPDDSYYKLRLYDPAAKAKYLGAKGHKPGVFWARRAGGKTLWVSEGEINALSLAEVVSDDVCSVGGTSFFTKETLSKYLQTWVSYDKLIIVLDDDKAGNEALYKAREYLLYKVPFVEFMLIKKPDINDRLCLGGKEEVLRVLQRPDFRC